MPQGSILGPLLFIIYISELPNFVKDSNISMYADDTGLSSKISNALEINSELLPDFLKVCDWLKANQLSLNIVKTEYMIIGTSQKLTQLGTITKIKVNNTLLKRVPYTKSLGLIIDETLSWANHIEHISVKIKRGIGVLKQAKPFISKHLLTTLYITILSLTSGTAIPSGVNAKTSYSINYGLHKIRRLELWQESLIERLTTPNFFKS